MSAQNLAAGSALPQPFLSRLSAGPPIAAALGALVVVAALGLPAGSIGGEAAGLLDGGALTLLLLAASIASLVAGLKLATPLPRGLCLAAAGILGGVLLLVRLRTGLVLTGGASASLLLLVGITVWLWQGMAVLSRIQGQGVGLIVPALFGGLLVYLWEALTVGYQVPRILLPPPSLIAATMERASYTLWIDFQQTFIRSVIPGFVMGCGAGFLVAVAIDRSPFLQRGLLPVGSMISAMPIIGIAPIMVMWFGFDWQSKAAVVVVMTFFPMMVNSLAGLRSTGAMEQDLMRSYAASYWQTLLKLRLPNALPFVFNALKLCSTLALIGAIVAEFFGTPIRGMGFRISSEVQRLNIDMVWATIVVAALAGSLSYGALVLLERATTFWHPSHRK